MEKIRFKTTSKVNRVQLKNYLSHLSERNNSDKISNVLSVSNRLGFVKQEEQFENRVVASKDKRNYKIVKRNNYAFNPARINVGSIARLKQEEAGIVSPMYVVFDTKNSLNKDFFDNFLQSQKFYNQLKKKLVGSVRQTLDFKSLSDMSLDLPEIIEQEKIGGFLSSFDKLIQKQQEKIGLLQELKKGYLQQMFPEKESNIPKVRFKGFTDAWEQRKLGEMLKERNEQIPENDEYPLMSFVQGIGVSPKGDRYDRSFLVKEENKKYKKTELGDFIYSSNNLETGSIGFNRTGKAVISPVYSIFSSKNEVESQFIGVLSIRKDFIAKMVRYRQGVVYGQWRIHEKDFLVIEINVPNHYEQREIVDFFSNVESLITLHQSKLDGLEEMKKGYMQRLFA